MEFGKENPLLRRIDFVTRPVKLWLILIGVALVLYLSRTILRYFFDARLDSPARFEQVVWMHSSLGFEPDTLIVPLYHLGVPSSNSRVTTEIMGLANGERSLSQQQLRRKGLHINPANVPSNRLQIKLYPGKNHNSLTKALEALVAEGYVGFRPGSFTSPDLYSFEVRARILNSDKIFRRTVHLRSWSLAELSLIWASLIIVVCVATTVTVRTITTLARHPQGPMDLIWSGLQSAWRSLQVFVFRWIICRGIARIFERAALSLSLMAAVASLSGVLQAPTSNIMNVFSAVLALSAHLMSNAASDKGRVLHQSLEEKQAAMSKEEKIPAPVVRRLAGFIAGLDQQRDLCRELEADPKLLLQTGKEIRTIDRSLRQKARALKQETKLAYHNEEQRRKALQRANERKIAEAREKIAGHVLAYLNSEEFRTKIPVFDHLVPQEEFDEKARVLQGEFRGITEGDRKLFRLISFRSEISAEQGEPLLVLAVSKEREELHLEQFVDEHHPIRTTPILLQKDDATEVPVHFKVKMDRLGFDPNRPAPRLEDIPITLADPEPDYREWSAALPPLRQILKGGNYAEAV